MNLIIAAIVLAIIAAVCDHLFGIGEPWKKLIFAGIAIIFVVGLVLLLVPGVFSGRLGVLPADQFPGLASTTPWTLSAPTRGYL